MVIHRWLLGVDFQERAQSPMKRRGAAGHHACLEHLKQLLSRRAEADRPLHVCHEGGLLGATEREERDGDEFPHLGRNVLTLAETELVNLVVGFDELRILPRRELPLGVDVAAGFLHPRDERVRPPPSIVVRRLLLHRVPPREGAYLTLPRAETGQTTSTVPFRTPWTMLVTTQP